MVNADFFPGGPGSHPAPRYRLLVHDKLVRVHLQAHCDRFIKELELKEYRVEEPLERLALKSINDGFSLGQIADVSFFQVVPVGVD